MRFRYMVQRALEGANIKNKSISAISPDSYAFLTSLNTNIEYFHK
jgi:hypothetical protein